MKIDHYILFILAFAFVPCRIFSAQEMRQVFEEMKKKQIQKKYRADDAAETPPAQTVQESRSQKAPIRPSRPPELQQNLEQPIPTPKLIKYSKPSGRIPVPSLIINSDKQTEEGEKLFDDGMQLLKASYACAGSVEDNRSMRDRAIDCLEQSFIKDPHTKVLAVFFLIYFTTRLPGVKIPENPYFMGAVHYEGPSFVDKFPELKTELESLATLGKKSSESIK